MTAMNTMKDGTQDEYIEKVGGKSAFSKLNAKDLSILCGMYAGSGKINGYIECTETYVNRFKNSSDFITHFMVLQSYEGLALTYNSLGRYEDADNAIDMGLELYKEQNRQDDFWLHNGNVIKTTEIELHAIQAVVANKRNDKEAEDKALAFVEQSIPSLDELGRGLNAKVRNLLTRIYFTLGDYDQAAEFAKSAKNYKDLPLSTNEKAQKVADAISTFGLSLLIEPLIEKAVANKMEEYQLATDTSLYYQAKADLEAKRYQDALDNFKKLESYTSMSNDFNLHWMYWYDYSKAYLAIGEREKALDTLKESIKVIESQRTDFNSEMGKMGFAQGKQQPYALMVKTLLADGQNEEAFAYVERSKARALVDLLAARDNINFGATPEAKQYLVKLHQIESRATVQKNKVEPETNTRSLVRAPKKELKQKYPELSSLISVDTLSSNQVGHLLIKNEVLVEYYVSGDDLIAFVLENGLLKVYPLNGKNLTANIRAYRKALTHSNSAWKKTSIALYKQLIRPFGKRVYNKNLVIVPHGPLHYLPFASLYDGKRFLVDKAQIRLMPSASVMSYVGKHKNTSEQMMILGNPDLHDKATDLPGAEKEAKAIAKLWSGADVRLKENATETALKNNAENYGMFHFASHGVFNPEQPLDSSLLLAADKQNDGHLTVAEIYGIHLNANLVTLSACQTGLGDIVNGDDVVGLNRGFLYAGADSILASLWSVEDAPTAYFMQSFYGYLKHHDKAKALQLAQLKTRKKYPHPSRWAAFQLTGASI